MLPKELVTQRKCRQQNVLISSKVESYRIRHSVRKILQERMAKGLEGRGQDVFQGKLREEILCIVESVCVREPCFVCRVCFICLFVLRMGWQFVHQHVSFLYNIIKKWIPVHVWKTHKKGKTELCWLKPHDYLWNYFSCEMLEAHLPQKKKNLCTGSFEQISHHCKNKSVHHLQHSQRCPCCPWKKKTLKQKILLIRSLTSKDSAKFIKVTTQESSFFFSRPI